MPTDYKQVWKQLYAPPAAPALVDAPPMRCLMVDGEGDPNRAPAYAAAVEALFSVAYGLKFALRRVGAEDYVVMPLEGLWWADDMDDFLSGRRERWRWTMLIAQPVAVPEGLLALVADEVARKKAPAARDVRLELLSEGLCAQVMHRGPYADEAPVIAALHAFTTGQGLALAGRQHEIYLSDPRRTAPEKMRTVLRQPVRRAA